MIWKEEEEDKSSQNVEIQTVNMNSGRKTHLGVNLRI